MPSAAARAALERQLEGGLFANVRDGDRVAIAQTFDWIAYDDRGPDGIATRGLFDLYAGRRIDLVAPGNASARYGLHYDPGASVWTLSMQK
jgi:hypothetical protein